jgi:hypothetical protein
LRLVCLNFRHRRLLPLGRMARALTDLRRPFSANWADRSNVCFWLKADDLGGGAKPITLSLAISISNEAT